MTPWTLPFFWTALAAGVLCGAALSLLGVFVVARREVFVGLTVAQLAGLGTVLGVVLGAGHGSGRGGGGTVGALPPQGFGAVASGCGFGGFLPPGCGAVGLDPLQSPRG